MPSILGVDTTDTQPIDIMSCETPEGVGYGSSTGLATDADSSINVSAEVLRNEYQRALPSTQVMEARTDAPSKGAPPAAEEPKEAAAAEEPEEAPAAEEPEEAPAESVAWQQGQLIHVFSLRMVESS